MRRRSNELLVRWSILTVIAVLCLARVSMATPRGALEAPSSEAASGMRKVSFDITPLESCNFGDLDLILNDLSAANGELRLQLSVESLGDGAAYVAYGSPREKKHPGLNLGTYEVLLPKALTPKAYITLLCSVPSGELKTTPCSRIQMRDFVEMIQPYSLSISREPGKPPLSPPFSPPRQINPKVYYAQYMLATDSAFWIPRDGSKDIFLELPEKTQGEIKKVRATVGSLPLRVSDSRLQLVVPFFSDKKCNGG